MTAHPTGMRFESVYRLFAEDGALLYVGMSGNVRNRLAQHAADKPWFHQVHSISIERHSTREDAALAEAVAIRDESPAMNIARPSKPLLGGDALEPTATRETPAGRGKREHLEYHCAECGWHIDGQSGALGVSGRLANAYTGAALNGVPIRTWIGSITVSTWTPLHWKCVPEYERRSGKGHMNMAVEIDRVRDTSELASITCELANFDLLEMTDWFGVMDLLLMRQDRIAQGKHAAAFRAGETNLRNFPVAGVPNDDSKVLALEAIERAFSIGANA